MRLRIQFEAELFAARPSVAVVMIEAAGPTSSSIAFEPGIPAETIQDFYGNTARRLQLPGGLVRVEYDAIVEYVPTEVDGIDDVDADLQLRQPDAREVELERLLALRSELERDRIDESRLG